MSDLSYVRQGRTHAALTLLLGIYAALAGAVIWLDAAPWIAAIVAACTLPALLDYLLNRRAGLSVDGRRAVWFSGRRTGEVALARVAKVRLDTRLDLAVRITLILDCGRRIRLPMECTPPPEALESRLKSLGIKVERRHFALVG